jgi:hypothetical protein
MSNPKRGSASLGFGDAAEQYPIPQFTSSILAELPKRLSIGSQAVAHALKRSFSQRVDGVNG